VFASVFAAQHLAYVVSCSGCCVASLVVFFGFVAFVVMSHLLTSKSSANDKSFTARMLLPLWFFVGLVR
jgi:molybdopterin biosynthesis enzyme